jgi:hypothetical protein
MTPHHTTPHQNSTHGDPEPTVPSPAKCVVPPECSVLRVTQRVQEALNAVPGGEAVDEYFGISGGVPNQSTLEAKESKEILQDILDFNGSERDFKRLYQRIVSFNEQSSVDPEVLRALMRSPKK